jgi:hypothetical protein
MALFLTPSKAPRKRKSILRKWMKTVVSARILYKIMFRVLMGRASTSCLKRRLGMQGSLGLITYRGWRLRLSNGAETVPNIPDVA